MKKEPNIKEAKKATLQSLINEPSVYHIDVIDNSMLPEKLKSKKVITFEIKPPVLYTLSKVSEIVTQLPDHIFDAKTDKKEAIKFIPQMVDIICIMAHGGSKKKMPDWYFKFILKNMTNEEVSWLLHETFTKCKTDFFLPYFQNAKLLNPMTMMKLPKTKKKDLIPTK